MTKSEILQQVAESTWQPEFEFTDDLNHVVDSILKPHEDYFLGLHSKVQEIIKREIAYANSVDNYTITFADICNWQKELFEHKKDLIDIAVSTLHENYENMFALKAGCLPNQHINLGLRTVNVRVGNWYPPKPMFLEDLKEMCFPLALEFDCRKTIDYSYYLNTGTEAVFEEDYDDISEYEKEILQMLTNWYKIFQICHFCEDLNGRVGGIVINIISYILTGKYLININYEKKH
jgi:hypothetical protein